MSVVCMLQGKYLDMKDICEILSIGNCFEIHSFPKYTYKSLSYQ